MTIDAQRLYGLVEQLLAAHAPSGAEAEMDALVTELATPIGDAIWQGRGRQHHHPHQGPKPRPARSRPRPQGRDRPHRQAR